MIFNHWMEAMHITAPSIARTPRFSRSSRGIVITFLCGAVVGCADAPSDHDHGEFVPQIDCNASTDDAGSRPDDGPSDGGTVDGRGIDASVGETPDAGTPAPPTKVQIERVTSAGDCSVSTIAAESSGADITVKDFAVTVDEKTGLSTADCDLTIGVSNTSGVSYAVEALTLNGSSALPPGVQGTVTANYRLTGLPSAGSVTHVFDVPSDGPFSLTGTAGSTSVFTPCSTTRNLQVSLSLALQNATPRASGKLSLTALQGLRLVTRPCMPASD